MIYRYLRTLNFLTDRMKTLLLFLLFLGPSNLSLDLYSARGWSTFILRMRGPRRPLSSYFYLEPSPKSTVIYSTSPTSVSSFTEILEDVSYSSQQKFVNTSDTSSSGSEVSYEEEAISGTESGTISNYSKKEEQKKVKEEQKKAKEEQKKSKEEQMKAKETPFNIKTIIPKMQVSENSRTPPKAPSRDPEQEFLLKKKQ
jgi:hypothetical protein